MHRRLPNACVGRLIAGCVVVCIALFATSSAKAADDIDWRWRRFQSWEYGATLGALAGGFYLRFGADPPDANWRGGILIDDWVHERTGVQGASNRRAVVTLTDALFFGAMGYRLVDSAILPRLARGNWDTALQMSMIDLEAFGFVSIALWGQQALFGRQRPYVDHCPGIDEKNCEPGSPERNRSFFAGHPAVVMTAAGLTCTHHARMPLYGGGAADTLACGLTVGAALLTGYGRVVTEMHYASDVAVGLGIGALAGWGLPALLHYRDERPKERNRFAASPRPVRVVPAPMLAKDRLGFGLAGLF